MAKWIMVVDDDTANLQMAGHILSKNNMRVTALKSGRALLDYIEKKGAPDLILLDIMMPEMDGFETLANLRQLEKNLGIPEIPVIFLTADLPIAVFLSHFLPGFEQTCHFRKGRAVLPVDADTDLTVQTVDLEAV